MFKQMESTGLQDLHFWQDSTTGLQAIIAIHDTFRGPAIGGCRFISYPDTSAAITDAIRLAKGMSYKAALAGLPYGGGKSVIIKPVKLSSRTQLMHSFGRFIDSLGGRYITAMDSGTQVSDMDDIANSTAYVTCTQAMGDPSPATAQGVFEGILASAQFRFGSASLANIHIALQGLGHVGYALAKQLHAAGARLTITDIDADKVAQAVLEFNASAVAAHDIYDVEADIFCPCGLGAILSSDTIGRLKCAIVAGSANNQLADPQQGDLLYRRNILYAPDYLINAGGLIFVALKHNGQSNSAIRQKVAQIHTSLSELYQHADAEQQSTSTIADIRAEALIQQARLAASQAT
ncbi:Glu/Leu/Phe/Val dehydrogenase dimerization domain-containing protein [Amphritea sp. 1_MG-2023]|uniref:Leu/Phe/Val dehydrogenase n=1 Tax=Amphritea sp. 1_MG-2023 TaxID=3062670 RepID=UPI0026E3FFBA|nr:Glu/Leu/Phe/Val dehydrogenase dimerization domain-containing protein [Amphritea sp. 1_MG-2023]MDO6564425.1 Glu/Leu/Phe/Val dehydrogenase dimerization domain-containing protein [Amphritea sp. 1_MG-2023]